MNRLYSRILYVWYHPTTCCVGILTCLQIQVVFGVVLDLSVDGFHSALDPFYPVVWLHWGICDAGVLVICCVFQTDLVCCSFVFRRNEKFVHFDNAQRVISIHEMLGHVHVLALHSIHILFDRSVHRCSYDAELNGLCQYECVIFSIGIEYTSRLDEV